MTKEGNIENWVGLSGMESSLIREIKNKAMAGKKKMPKDAGEGRSRGKTYKFGEKKSGGSIYN